MSIVFISGEIGICTKSYSCNQELSIASLNKLTMAVAQWTKHLLQISEVSGWNRDILLSLLLIFICIGENEEKDRGKCLFNG